MAALAGQDSSPAPGPPAGSPAQGRRVVLSCSSVVVARATRLSRVVPQTGYDQCLAATTDSRWTPPTRLTVASGAGARRWADEAPVSYAHRSMLTGAETGSR